MCAAAAACTSVRSPKPLRLGTTTTVQASGMLALIDSLAPPAPVAAVIGPSGQILRSAAAGDVDVALTHAPSLEQRMLVAPRLALARCPFVLSSFAIVGPAADPAAVAHAADAADAFARIARARATFVSRGDSSGTHVKELAQWQAAGIRPQHQPWYLETGTDQGSTLHVAEQRDAYALADLPTLARLPGLELKVLFSGDTALLNHYTLYVATRGDTALGRAFLDWALATWRPRILAIDLPDGTPAFTAPREDCGLAADAPPAAQAPTVQPVLGRWDYRAAAAPQTGAGVRFTVVFDSAAGDSAFGSVGGYFAGDVGARPGTFGRVRARVTVDSVTIEIPFAQTGPEPLRFAARRGADTLHTTTGATFVRRH